MTTVRRRASLLMFALAVMPAALLVSSPTTAGENDETWSASIALDSAEPRYAEYLDKLRAAIKAKWGYPCAKNQTTGQCEYKTTQLVVEFGVRKDGTVVFVTVLEPSGYAIYDDYALMALKYAAPFPPIPDSFSPTGVPIRATFRYVVQPSLRQTVR